MIFSFLTLFFLPIVIFDFAYITEFWLNYWFLPIIFFITILTINFFFIFNWSIIHYTKTGNWDAVVNVLEKRIYERRFITYSNVKLLVYSYFLLGKEYRTKALEKYVRERRKSIYNKAFLMFCCANLISDSSNNLKTYFEGAVNNKSLKGRDWIFINYAFVLISEREFDKALGALKKIEKSKNEPVLELTWLYFMYIASHHEDQKNIDHLRINFVRRIDAAKFEKKLDVEKGDIHILFLSKIINQAKEWAYGSRSNTAQAF